MLAQAIVRQGLKNVAAGANPLGLNRGIEVAVDQVVEYIKSQSKEISGKDQIARVATISAGDEEIGDVIADAIDKVGKDGVVNVEEGQTFGMDLEFTEGMQFDKGYISPYMVTAQDATISAGDEEIGDVIADAIDKVGKDGVVNVEEGQTFGMDLEFTEGMQFDKGYISPYMVTAQERTSSSPRACSSTRATSPRTWSPTRTGWRPPSRTPTS